MNNEVQKTNGNAVATKQQTPINSLIGMINKMGGEMAKILPDYITPERMMRIAVTQIRKTPKLAQCTQESVLSAIMELARIGLEPDGRNAYLLPYNNSKNINGNWIKVMECELRIDYKGLIQLAFNSGKIDTIHADVICENDEFIYNKGVVERHVPDFKTRGNVYAVYAMARFKNGSEKYEVMNIEEVENIRKRSSSPSKGPWASDFNEMAKKTVFKRLSKWLPLNAKVRDAIQVDDKEFINKISDKVISSLPQAKIQALPQEILEQSADVEFKNVDKSTGEVIEPTQNETADPFNKMSVDEEQALFNDDKNVMNSALMD